MLRIPAPASLVGETSAYIEVVGVISRVVGGERRHRVDLLPVRVRGVVLRGVRQVERAGAARVADVFVDAPVERRPGRPAFSDRSARSWRHGVVARERAALAVSADPAGDHVAREDAADAHAAGAESAAGRRGRGVADERER